MAYKLITTELKEGITNERVARENEFALHVDDTNDNVVTVTVKNKVYPFNVRLVGDSYFTDSTGSVNLGKSLILASQTSTFYISAGVCDVFISNKRTIFSLLVRSYRVSFNIEDLLYYSGEGVFDALYLGDYATERTKAYGDISNWKCGMKIMNTRDNHIKGSLKNLIDSSPSLVSLNIFETEMYFDYKWIDGKTTFAEFTPNELCFGELKYFANTNVTRLSFSEYTCNTVYGSIEDFVNYAIEKGVTPRTIKFAADIHLFNRITYQGVTLQDSALTGVTQFTWDNQGNITWS